jgi:hypothetical protein
MTDEQLRAVPAVLERFDSSFAAFVAAFNEGQYVLWLGSGISRERAPSVGELIGRVAEHLRSNIEVAKADCEYRVALDEVLRLADLNQTELGVIDYSIPFQEWPYNDRIVAALITKYSRVLDVLVGDDKPEDYLVWTGLDVPNTYGDPNLEPDVEHYCIAILMLEGVVEAAVTANWDGLLEKALNGFTPSFDALVRVAVKPDDFRIVGKRLEIVKVHGCAIRARNDETSYRDSLIARHSQISTWTEQPKNSLMRKQLELRYAIRPTMMIGLSAQDENFHTIFAAASRDLARSWPASPPAVVLSEERLEPYHQSVLRTTYGTTYQGNSSAIKDSALLGAYGKPVLMALVLSSLTEKLSFLVEHEIGSTWAFGAVGEFQADLRGIRDLVAKHADPSGVPALGRAASLEFQRKFAARLIDVTNFALAVFRTGLLPTTRSGYYEPISDRPAAQAILNADFPSKQFGRFGVALALIGRGLTAGQWSAVPGDSAMATDGVIRLVAAQRSARVFFVKDAVVLTQLELNGSFDSVQSDVFIVVADEEPPTQTRSPRSRFGRDGRMSAGRFSVASSISDTGSVDDLYEAFRLASGF